MGEPEPHREPHEPNDPHGARPPQPPTPGARPPGGSPPPGPYPPPGGPPPWGAPPGGPYPYTGVDEDEKFYHTTVRQELLEGAVTALAVAVTGVLFGLLWLWLAPRVPLVATEDAVYLKNTEGEEAVGADGVFVLLGLGMGAVTGAVVYWLRRRGGVGLVLGLALGGLLGSLLAWRLGVWLGPTQDVAAHAREVGPGKVFDAPLKLRAVSAVLVWPMAAVLVHLLHTAVLGPRWRAVPPGKPPVGYAG